MILTRQHLDAYLEAEQPYDPTLTPAQVPIDAATFSASGVDPHISKANAAIQARRIAAVRHLPLARVQRLIADAHRRSRPRRLRRARCQRRRSSTSHSTRKPMTLQRSVLFSAEIVRPAISASASSTRGSRSATR